MDAKIVVEHGDKRLCAIHRICGSGSKAIVIMAHGGPGGDKRGPLGLFDVLAERLEVELGLSSLRFDFLGYGESDGTPLDLTLRSRALELGSVVAWAVERGYKQLALVAESLGASSRAAGDRRARLSLAGHRPRRHRPQGVFHPRAAGGADWEWTHSRWRHPGGRRVRARVPGDGSRPSARLNPRRHS
ncbi:MAG: hypothetical protein NTV92_09030, partial [Candidatus Bipolaricaulota bacterium]|nr:hypothetical protein [Candidatus Bipolaricaulota bacterium]